MAQDDALVEWLGTVFAKHGLAAGAAPANQGAAAAQATVTLGEPAVAKQVPLGKLRWGGRYRGKLWGLTDTDGSVVRGGANPQLRDLASMNDLGERALLAIAGLEALDEQWRAEHDAVQQAAQAAQGDLKKLEQALPAMRKRNKSGDFHDDVDGYLVALEHAESTLSKIPKAEKDFNKAAHLLKRAVYELEGDEAQKAYKVAEQELKGMQADIKEAHSIFKTVMDIALKIGKQDWKGLATKAVSHLGKQSIAAAYAPELEVLKQKLSTAKNEIARLQTAGLVSAIEAEREGLESAAISFEIAQKDLQKALDQLVRKQTNARNELQESSSTAIAGQMISQRAKQLHSIATAQATCARYLRDSAGVSRSMAQISRKFSLVGSWLDDAAKADPVYSSDTPYAKTLGLSATSNAVQLDRWHGWVEHVQDQCGKAQESMSVEGANGPMGSFDKAIELVKQGLS